MFSSTKLKLYKVRCQFRNMSTLENLHKYTGDRISRYKRIEQTNKELKAFAMEFNNNRIELSSFHKMILTIGSSVVSCYNPRRVDMLACCSETWNNLHLETIFKEMSANDVGNEILRDKPTIITHVDMESLLRLPTNTFGFAYAMFLENNKVNEDNKIPVRFIDNIDFAYIMTRCRQIHDYLHIVLNVPTNKIGEIALKWVEAINIGLPTAYLAAILGCLHVPARDRKKYLEQYLPLAIVNGQNHNKFFLVYWEKMWQEDLNQLRKNLDVVPFP